MTSMFKWACSELCHARPCDRPKTNAPSYTFSPNVLKLHAATVCFLSLSCHRPLHFIFGVQIASLPAVRSVSRTTLPPPQQVLSGCRGLQGPSMAISRWWGFETSRLTNPSKAEWNCISWCIDLLHKSDLLLTTASLLDRAYGSRT